jgi:hypothetical protein
VSFSNLVPRWSLVGGAGMRIFAGTGTSGPGLGGADIEDEFIVEEVDFGEGGGQV